MDERSVKLAGLQLLRYRKGRCLWLLTPAAHFFGKRPKRLGDAGGMDFLVWRRGTGTKLVLHIENGQRARKD